MFWTHPPCLVPYEVDILCTYKVVFRSSLSTAAICQKPVFCAKVGPCTWQGNFIQRWFSTLYPAGFPQKKHSIYAVIHFINSWFSSKKDHKMLHHPLYRNIRPQRIRADFFLCQAGYMAKHFIEGKLPFFVAAIFIL